MKMNSFIGKEILSLIRDGNYAHAGEEEAIELTFGHVPKDKNRLMLDVGCGRGGTAQYLSAHGWGKVIGIDIDSTSINYAQQQYETVEFHPCNVVDAPKHLKTQFDLIYLFNSFYSFDNQSQALAALRSLAKESTRVLIFDYLDRGDYSKYPIEEEGSPFLPHPIETGNFNNMLAEAGWSLTEMRDISAEYQKWYSQLMDNIHLKRNKIIQVGGEDAFETVNRLYGALLESIKKGQLGGAIIEAQPNI